MTGPIRNQAPPTSRPILWLYVLTPVVLFAAAVALSDARVSQGDGHSGGLCVSYLVGDSYPPLLHLSKASGGLERLVSG